MTFEKSSRYEDSTNDLNFPVRHYCLEDKLDFRNVDCTKQGLYMF